jgi:nicotinate-nucleotide pyrophosphorylase (carboxylating)
MKNLKTLLGYVEEDLGRGDVTSESIIPEDLEIRGEILAKKPGILAGLEEVALLLDHYGLVYKVRVKDGGAIREGDAIIEVQGSARKILGLERLLLNLLMRMSGIATETKKLAEICGKYGVAIAGTRKTTPGFRGLEKKSIALGGGYPHRLDLGEAVLIKDNHIAAVGLEKAVARARKKVPHMEVEVEVSNLEDAVRACKDGASTVMLDNLSPREVKSIIHELEKQGLREKVKIELSGGITPENLEEYARLSPDYISMGYLTTGAKWLDMSMKVGRI